MNTDDLTIKTVRAGPACTLVVSGELCYSSASGFLHHAARVVDDRTGRLVLDWPGSRSLTAPGYERWRSAGRRSARYAAHYYRLRAAASRLRTFPGDRSKDQIDAWPVLVVLPAGPLPVA
jgi:hypothetical protein